MAWNTLLEPVEETGVTGQDTLLEPVGDGCDGTGYPLEMSGVTVGLSMSHCEAHPK